MQKFSSIWIRKLLEVSWLALLPIASPVFAVDAGADFIEDYPTIVVLTTTPATKWRQEPSDFIGIALGYPLTSSVKNDCRIKDDRWDSLIVESGNACINNTRLSREKAIKIVEGINIAPLFSQAAVKTSDNSLNGDVLQVQAKFPSSSFGWMAEIMATKFGTPHSETFEKIYASKGREFEDKVLTWVGDQQIIRLHSCVGTQSLASQGTCVGTVTVSKLSYMRLLSEKHTIKTKSAAAAL